MVAPPARVCATMAAICGPATTTETTAAVAAGISRCRQARLASHGTSAPSTTMSTRTNDSWSVSRLAPSTTPSTTACLPHPPPASPPPSTPPALRRSRTAASSASGRNTAPAARLSWYQACQAMIEDSPKNAPAMTAPVCVGSHSRATRYIA